MGNISEWFILVYAPVVGPAPLGSYGEISTGNCGAPLCDINIVRDQGSEFIGAFAFGRTSANPGTWIRSVVPVPVPAADWLFLSAVLFLSRTRK